MSASSTLMRSRMASVLIGLTPCRLLLCGTGVFLVSLILAAAATAMTPGEAYGIPPLVIGAGLVLTAIGGIVLAGDGASDWLAGLFRDGINGLLDMMSTMVSLTVSGDTLTSAFSGLFEGLYPVIYHIHHMAVMPMAYIVIAVCLVVGLVKIFSEAGQHEAGVDTYKVMMTFFLFAIGYNAVTYSFEIMLAIYSLITEMTNAILGAGTEAVGSVFHPVDEDVGNIGILFMMFISTVFAWLVTVVVFLLSQAVVIVRSIQIYAMTCFASLPLACFINETSRPIATGYLKKYIATVAAGAVLALLFIMFAAVASQTATTSIPPDSPENIMRWCVEILSSLVLLVAFGWCIFKSGSWTRDWMGV